MTKQMLVADEVAEILRVDRQRVYSLTREGDFEGVVVKLGDRQYRYDSQALQDWIAQGGSQKEGEQHFSTKK